MRALLPTAACLLLALRCPRVDPAPAPAHAPAGLLVLRAACRLRDPAAFDPERVREVAESLVRPELLVDYRILGYKESCGVSWEDAVARASLAALGRGGAVAAAGWAGARACALLRGAGVRGRGQPPPACSAPAARAALAAAVARRLGWRRAVLLRGAGAGAECGASLRVLRRLLLAEGVAVRSLNVVDELPRDFNVVIACATAAAGLQSMQSMQAVRAVLLLHTPADGGAAISNNTLVVGKLPYLSNVEYSKSSLDLSVAVENNSFFLNLTINSTKVNDSISETKAKTGAEINNLNKPNGDTEKRKAEDKTSGQENMIKYYKVPRLLVTEDGPAPAESSAERVEYVLRNAILEAFIKETNENVQTAKHIFYLLEDVDNTNVWRELAVFNTTATWHLDEDEWSVTVEEREANETAWERWGAADGAGGAGGARAQWARGALWAAAGVCGALAGAGAARAAGGAARRRRGRDVVLRAADFAFPADEARRVPDGMETMLSCWLQQLHEFGGPAPAPPPPLPLPPAPLSLPPAPSAPSASSSASRLALDRCVRYKGDAVQLKGVPAEGAELVLRRKATDVLLVLYALRHENLNPFIGCLCEVRPALVWDRCGRGSLEDVLKADAIRLDWTFRLSLLTDLARGLRYLHASPLRVHGRLSSRNCVVDSRWVLRLTDYGLPAFRRAQGLPEPPRSARELLWTAPELLRAGAGARPTQPGDVFAFAIIMQEVIVRGEPYCMLALSPEEIVEKLCRPPPLIRPSVSIGAAPPEAVSVMRQCWAEAPELRPSTDALADIFRLLHQGRKVNIIDSMFQMLEKYSNNLEELIKERTEELDMEKKKTEQLLNRMLPRSVAERLLAGLSVEPEEFEEVSIYFSDIVGFTALAARSSPVQVVALLNDLYTTFDAAIEQYKVYKVETIGDAYMVVGGLPVRAHDHAERVATMALHLLHLAGHFRIRHLPGTPLHLRSGLHSGPCCAAVVGLTMPRYCLFGDTVNTASRMESTGAAWRIQASAATAARLQAAGGFRLRSRGLRAVKGKGLMHTYWLLGKDGFDKPLPTPPPLPSEEALLEHEAENEPAPPSASPAPAFAAAAAPAPAPVPPAPVALHEKYAWQSSGAVSADSSPPAARALYGPHAHARYRCLGGTGGTGGAGERGDSALWRQWSLERGEALAVRAVSGDPVSGDPANGDPANGDAVARASRGRPSPAPAVPRYRTRPA